MKINKKSTWSPTYSFYWGHFKIWVRKSSDIIESKGNFLGCGIKTDILKYLQYIFYSYWVKILRNQLAYWWTEKNVGHRYKFFDGLCQSSLHGSYFFRNIIEKGHN